MRRAIALALVALVAPVSVGATACNTLPPKELVDARAAYATASKGPASQQTPAELHVAKEALDQAERSFNDDGDGPDTKDYAYVASRKAELADSSARLLLAQKEKEKADRDGQNLTGQELQNAQRDLAGTKRELAQEKTAREQAEKDAALAAVELEKVGTVKKEARGTVVVIPASSLFGGPADGSTLSPAAILKVNAVADAITKSYAGSTVSVDGYTDSQGQRQFNVDLSKKRADAVRAQLVSRGVPAGQVTATGFGPDKPLVDNATTENRTNNRRVEVVIAPSPTTTPTKPRG